jgi:hypothetical protein
MDEFDFDNDITFSTNINSIKNNNTNNNTNNNINNKSHYIDEILNYNEDSYKPNNFLSDNDIFPCESNKCKKYTIESMSQPIVNSFNKNIKKPNKTKKTKKLNKTNETNKNEINIYIIIIILFILFNNHELYNSLLNKGFSYYKSLMVRLVCFLISFYLINNYIVS